MERRTPAITFLAITALCATLGLLGNANGVLMLAPFLILVLPLLAGLDPVSPAIEKLIGMLGLDFTPGSSHPVNAFGSARHLPARRIAIRSLSVRGPPRPAIP